MVNYVKVTNRKTFQNKIFPELNYKKPSPTVGFLRNCGIAQNLKFAKRGKGQFCAKWILRMIAQIVVFSLKTDAQRKKKFAFRSAKFAQKFCEWKPYQIHPSLFLYLEFLVSSHHIHLPIWSSLSAPIISTFLFRVLWQLTSSLPSHLECLFRPLPLYLPI